MKHYNIENRKSKIENKMAYADDKQVKQYKHYANTSLISMGFTGMGKFVPGLTLIGLATYLYSFIPYIKDVEKTLVEDRKVNVDVLFFVGNILTIGLAQYFTASFSIFVRYAAKMKLAEAKDTSKKIITDAFTQLPQTVWILSDQVELEIPLKQIKTNDVVVVRTGEVIPVDGMITQGTACIDQSALTGESQPAEKGHGEYVYANTVILSGRIYIRVENSGESTMAARISMILLHSTDYKSKVQLKGEEWADKAIVPMLAGTAVILPTLGPVAAAVFINSHIGNRIRLLAPFGTLKHITLATQKGILVKDGRALESLCEVDTIIFDKTGTLTTLEPEVKQIISCSLYQENEILYFAAIAEAKLTHPIARAIINRNKLENSGWTEHDAFHHSRYEIGHGITAFIGNQIVRVGSIRFIEGESIRIPEEIREVVTEAHEIGNTIVLVALADQLIGAIELHPQIRPEVKNMITRLRTQGIKHFAIVSGDHRYPTQKLAEELGIDEFYCNILPEGKASIVEQMQQEKRTVCFIGDGINDAIAMKKANVSISLAGSATIATDAAEVVFLDGTLLPLCDFFDIAQQLDKNLQKSLKLTLAPGVINLCGAFIFNFSIFTSQMVSSTFSWIAIKDVMKPLQDRRKLISHDKTA
ncbi:MAG: heavy metal translocating P-type ATPase [Desulfobacterales bacterium]|nr:heavy metal translocating P-type ATPase [Desulfobacterales bacterium]